MESESCQSDITSKDSTRRIVKYFSKCLIELTKHTESIQYKHNKILNYDISSTIHYDSGHELDITEHNIKSEVMKEGPIFKEIDKIKQCIVELLIVCSQQNILIDYDTNRSHVTTYDTFDDSQRILVMNHLTLHVISLVENIYLSLKFFKSSKYIENGQQIKKTFSNIYKEIKSLPMRADIVENMDSSFNSLTPKSEYRDSCNYLVEKLNILCKYISKFNKSYKKKCGFNYFESMESNTDDDNSSQKNFKNEQTFIKPENDYRKNYTEHGSLFKIPNAIENINPNMKNTNKRSDETKKRKKDHINVDLENIPEFIETNNPNKEHSDGTKQKKRHKKIDSEIKILSIETVNPNISNDITNRSDKIKKRKKHELNLDSEIKIPESETVNPNMRNRSDKIKKRKKQIHLDSEVSESIETVNSNVENDTIKRSNVTKKHENLDVENKNSNNCELVSERDLLLNELLNDSICRFDISENKSLKSKKKKSKVRTEPENNDNSYNIFEKELTNNNKENKNQNKQMNGYYGNNNNETSNSKEKNNKNPNQKEKSNEMNDNKLFYLRSNFLSDLNDSVGCVGNNIIYEDDDSDNDEIPSEILTAIENGDVEIDYDNNECDDFTKIINENSLNENERFLYIQELLDNAHAKLALSEETKERLANLSIMVNWEVPPAHLACSNLSKGPNAEEKELFAKLGITYGPFTAKEDKIIRDNWESFYKQHNLENDPNPFLLLVIEHKRVLTLAQRKKFLQYIGRGLPHKCLHSIFRRFKTLFGPKMKIGRFTPQEDELILTYLNKVRREDNGRKYARLSPLINRSRSQIERRYRILKDATKGLGKRITWNLELKQKFLDHLLKETRSENVEDLRDKDIDLNTYIIIGKLMNISPSKLKIHWTYRLHTELFSLEPINIDLIKYKLIKKFRELECDDWKTVNWDLMKDMFDGITKSYLWITLKNLINDSVPDKYHSNLKDSINYLYDNYLPTLKERKSRGLAKILPRLRCENGILIQYK